MAKQKLPTVADACRLYRKFNRTCDQGNKNRHIANFEKALGNVPLRKLKRKDIWDHVAKKNWPTRLEALQKIKTVLCNAVKPKKSWCNDVREPLPAPLITKADNCLEGVKVSIQLVQYDPDAAEIVPTRERIELEIQMTAGSEPAYQYAHKLADTTNDIIRRSYAKLAK